MLEFREVVRPYPGLRPFESWEGEIFFGREAHTDRLLEILREQGFLAVIGPSGSGKSSLVRAGLLPALPLGSVGTGSDWRIALMRPGNRPLQRLACSLLGRRALGTELVGEERIPTRETDITPDVALVEAELRRGPHGLIDLVQGTKGKPEERAGPNLLVVVDQFEEIFTYADAGTHQADESEAFVNLLLTSRSARKARIFVLLAMRTDFLGNCVRFLDLADAINRGQYLTPRLNRDQTQQAIVGPARIFGGSIEETLIAELINSVSSDPDQLPILQHALARMWTFAVHRSPKRPRITWDDFRAAGGIRNALDSHAEEVLATLNPDQVAAAEVLFRAITDQRGQGAGGQAVRRPQTLERIAAWSNRNWRDFEPVMSAFAAEDIGFLSHSGPLNEGSIADISHEALMRQWATLRTWVAREAFLAAEYRGWRERAAQFDAGSGGLLTGADLARASEWLRGSPRMHASAIGRPDANWAARYWLGAAPGSEKTTGDAVTEFVSITRFIDESEKAEVRELDAVRRKSKILLGALIISVAFFILATILGVLVYQAKRGESVARHQLEATLQRLERALEAEQKASNVARDEKISATASGYWNSLVFSDPAARVNEDNTLLDLARATRETRERFLEQALRNSSVAKRFNTNPEGVTAAAVGISPMMRNWALTFLSQVEADATPNPEVRLARVSLANLLRSDIVDTLFREIKAARGDMRQLRTFGQMLAAAIGKLPDTQLGRITDRLLEEMRITRDPDQRQAFAQALAAALGKLPDAQAERMTGQLLAEVRGGRDPDQRQAFAQALSAMGTRIVGTEALFTAIKSTTDPGSLRSLGQALAAAVSKLPDAQVGPMTEQLLAEIRAASDADQRQAFAQALSAMGTRIVGTEALFTAIKSTTDPGSLRSLGQALATAVGKLSDAQGGSITEQLLVEIRATPNSGQRQAFAEGLSALAATPSALEALFTAIKGTADPSTLRRLGQALAVAVGKLPDPQVGPMTEQLLTELRAASDQNQQQAFAEGLSARAAPPSAIEALFTAIKGTTDSSSLRRLGQALAAAVGKLPSAQVGPMTEHLLAEIRAARGQEQQRAFAEGLSALATTATSIEALFAAVKRTIDPGSLNALGQVLAAAMGKLPDQRVELMIDRLLKEIATASDSAHRLVFCQSLAPLASKLTGSRAATAASAFLAAFENTEESKDPSPGDLRSSSAFRREILLRDFLFGMSRESGEVVDDQRIDFLESTLMDPWVRERDKVIGQGLAAAIRNLSDTHAASLTDRLLTELTQARSVGHVLVLRVALTASAGSLPSERTGPVTDKLIEAITTVATTLQSTKPEGTDGWPLTLSKLHALGLGLEALASSPRLLQPGRLADRLVVAIAASPSAPSPPGPQRSLGPFISLGEHRALGRALHAVLRKLPDNQVEQLVSTLLAAMKGTEEPARLRLLAQGLTIATARLPEASAQKMLEKLLAEMEATADARQVDAFGRVIVRLTEQIRPSESLLRALVEVLKYPSTPRDELIESMRKKVPELTPAQDGVWAFLEGLKARFPQIDLDLDTPPKSPSKPMEPAAETRPHRQMTGGNAH